jgi:hypothetical protein
MEGKAEEGKEERGGKEGGIKGMKMERRRERWRTGQKEEREDSYHSK